MKKEKVIQKKYYDVKVEVTVPALLIYRVLAEDAKEASELIKNKQPTSIKYRLNMKKSLSLKVYEAGCSVIKYIINKL